MHEALTEGGLIRKLWIGEANIYRNHLLRLDRDSRHSRFGGAVSDEFIENYVTTAFGLNTVVHGFFVDGVLRGAALGARSFLCLPEDSGLPRRLLLAADEVADDPRLAAGNAEVVRVYQLEEHRALDFPIITQGDRIRIVPTASPSETLASVLRVAGLRDSLT